MLDYFLVINFYLEMIKFFIWMSLSKRMNQAVKSIEDNSKAKNVLERSVGPKL